METTFFQQLWEGFSIFFTAVDWRFVAIFIVISWLFNEGSEHPVKYTWLNWFNTMPKDFRVFLLGLILAIGYAYVYDVFGKVNYAQLIYSVLTGMVAWKLGIKWVFAKIKSGFQKFAGFHDDAGNDVPEVPNVPKVPNVPE